MDQEELISKKELLRLTGISYGQLYRWKRQHLLPEAWFMKQSSFTGQETFFPKYKILARISVILELKDQYSLEELAAIFAPESTDRKYSFQDVQKLLGLSDDLQVVSQEVWKRETFNFTELLFIYIGNDLERSMGLTRRHLHEWLTASKQWVKQFDNNKKTPILDQQISIVRKKETILFLMFDGKEKIYPDAQSEVVGTFSLAERSHEMNMALQHISGG